MLPVPLLPNLTPMSRTELNDLAERIAELRSEATVIIAETRAAVRRSREIVADIRAANDRDARIARS